MRQHKRKAKIHEPVLVEEVLTFLGLKDVPLNNQARFIDATVGTGGHSVEIAKSGAKLLGIDADKKMLEVAKKRLKTALRVGKPSGLEACPPPSQTRGYFKLVHGNFRKIDKIAEKYGFENVDGILFDLGVSTLHFKSIDRGFSFQYRQSPLDMRIDEVNQSVTAATLLNALPGAQLIKLFMVTLSKGKAERIARKIVVTRKKNPFETIGDFPSVIGEDRTHPKLHPATLPLLALRIAVNSELENLKATFPKAFDLLKKGGKLVIISFHSQEDRLVKNFFRDMKKKDLALILTKKPHTPNATEIEKNPRARSAKLRVLEKI